MPDLTLILFVAGVGLVMGGVLGWLVASLARGKESSNRAGAEDQKVSDPALPSSAPHPEALEVVQLWVDRRSGKLIPQVEGRVITSVEDLTGGQNERMRWAVQALAAWLGLTPPRIEPQQKSSPVQPPAENELPGAGESPPAGRVGFSPTDVLARALRSEVTQPSTPAKSIAAQIDEILQEKLAGSEMQNRAIRLMEIPGKGMVVMVGLEQYQGVSEVPDPEIRELIKASVGEWERRVGEKK